MFLYLLFFVVISLSYEINGSPVTDKTSMLSLISKECEKLVRNYNQTELEYFKNHIECRDFIPRNLTNTSEKLDENEILCPIYYFSFISLCNRIPENEMRNLTLIFGNYIGEDKPICTNLSLIPENARLKFEKVVKDEDTCNYICNELNNGHLEFRQVCRKAYYLNSLKFEPKVSGKIPLAPKGIELKKEIPETPKIEKIPMATPEEIKNPQEEISNGPAKKQTENVSKNYVTPVQKNEPEIEVPENPVVVEKNQENPSIDQKLQPSNPADEKLYSDYNGGDVDLVQKTAEIPVKEEQIVEDKKPISESIQPNVSDVDGADIDGNSSFFTYFTFTCVIFVAGYIGYHNKQKILALVLEGRSSRKSQRGQRRPNSANYHKLDTNLEEAISSSCNKTTSHIIY